MTQRRYLGPAFLGFSLLVASCHTPLAATLTPEKQPEQAASATPQNTTSPSNVASSDGDQVLLDYALAYRKANLDHFQNQGMASRDFGSLMPQSMTPLPTTEAPPLTPQPSEIDGPVPGSSSPLTQLQPMIDLMKRMVETQEQLITKLENIAPPASLQAEHRFLINYEKTALDYALESIAMFENLSSLTQAQSPGPSEALITQQSQLQAKVAKLQSLQAERFAIQTRLALLIYAPALKPFQSAAPLSEARYLEVLPPESESIAQRFSRWMQPQFAGAPAPEPVDAVKVSAWNVAYGQDQRKIQVLHPPASQQVYHTFRYVETRLGQALSEALIRYNQSPEEAPDFFSYLLGQTEIMMLFNDYVALEMSSRDQQLTTPN